MGSLENILEKPTHKDYCLLKNYILFREDCYTKDGEFKKIKLYPETIEQYFEAYEFLSKTNIRGKYRTCNQIIRARKEKVTFSTKRSDNILVKLFCHAEAMELLMTAYPDDEDKSLYSISTIIGEYNAQETYSVSYTALTRQGIIIAQEGMKMPTIVREKVIEHNYGIIGQGIFPKQ